jgi:hypothetical protein
MNCPACGADNTYGLKYCKRCGESLNVPTTTAPSGFPLKKLTGMFWAIAVFGIAALGIMFGCAIPLMYLGGDRRTLIPLFGLGAGMTLMIVLMLIKQLARLVRLVEDEYRAARQIGKPIEQTRPQIAAPPHAVSSVTEHTTRNFDQAYQAPRVRE